MLPLLVYLVRTANTVYRKTWLVYIQKYIHFVVSHMLNTDSVCYVYTIHNVEVLNIQEAQFVLLPAK